MQWVTSNLNADVVSPVLADLLLEVRPRYHIAGGRQTFWARVPYQNQDLGAGAHVTRFISLAEVCKSNMVLLLC